MGPSMNSYEQFYIQLYSYKNKLVTEQYTGEQNPLYHILYYMTSKYVMITRHLSLHADDLTQTILSTVSTVHTETSDS
jgi:hypothetical protein